MRLEDYPTEPRYDARILSTERITDEGADAEVRELVLEVDRDEFNFEIGQSIGVLVEGPQEFGGSMRQRLYTVADTPSAKGDAKPQITLVVRRCDYIDDYSGEQYPGVNSNFICDRKAGDTLSITGPFGLPFTVPEDRSANLLLIGLGTGIAPFRAFVKHIYQDIGEWEGRVRLLYGARAAVEEVLLQLDGAPGRALEVSPSEPHTTPSTVIRACAFSYAPHDFRVRSRRRSADQAATLT